MLPILYFIVVNTKTITALRIKYILLFVASIIMVVVLFKLLLPSLSFISLNTSKDSTSNKSSKENNNSLPIDAKLDLNVFDEGNITPDDAMYLIMLKRFLKSNINDVLSLDTWKSIDSKDVLKTFRIGIVTETNALSKKIQLKIINTEEGVSFSNISASFSCNPDSTIFLTEGPTYSCFQEGMLDEEVPISEESDLSSYNDYTSGVLLECLRSGNVIATYCSSINCEEESNLSSCIVYE
jgi:hypothetical protein